MNKRATLTISTLLMILSTVWFAHDIEPVSAQNAPGRPILVIHDNSAPSNPFGLYLGEILRAEGLNSFNVETLDNIASAATLTSYKVVILAEAELSAAQAGYFTNYVTGGGHLIAMRPDTDSSPQFKALFGLVGTPTVLTDGYMKMPGNDVSAGLRTETLQIHGDADQYTLAGGAEKIADLYSNATTSTAFPAVVRDSTGRGVAFLYDLAKSVVYMRQGNPANASVDVDSDGVLRTIDLFQGAGGNAPHWVDLNKVPIPQADEQQRLLARLVTAAVGNAHPMPQLWYFPDTEKTMLIATGDAHANSLSAYQAVIDAMNNHDGEVTLYLSIGGVDIGQTQIWHNQGHEFGIHPPFYKEDAYVPYDIDNLQDGFQTYAGWFTTVFNGSGIPRSRTVRNHQVAWEGWTDAADYAIESLLLDENNPGMDTNFYHWGEWLQKPDTSWARGYITGSGQPMKFINDTGEILPYYQQLTQLVDEQFFAVGAGSGWEATTPAVAIAASEALIDSSLAGDYAAIMTQFHVDYTNFGNVNEWVVGVLDYANEKDIPIWNADDWLTFTEKRHDSNYNSMSWNATTNTLTFNVSATTQAGMTLSTVLPLSHKGGALQTVRVNGTLTPFSFQTIKGQNVAFVTAPIGNHTISAAYATPAVEPAPNAAPTRTFYPSPNVTLTWDNITWAQEYQVEVAVDALFVTKLTLPNDGIVSANTLSLMLTVPSESTYYWRVRAKDPVTGWKAFSKAESFTVDVP